MLAAHGRDQGAAMRVDGITWHGVVLKRRAFASMTQFAEETLGLTPLLSEVGRRMYLMRNGTMLDLYAPETVPAYGFNNGMVFGFQVDDVQQASAEVAGSGMELLGEVTRLPNLPYAFRHFRGADGRVYGLIEVQPIEW
jgi:hypothetical protein